MFLYYIMGVCHNNVYYIDIKIFQGGGGGGYV